MVIQSYRENPFNFGHFRILDEPGRPVNFYRILLSPFQDDRTLTTSDFPFPALFLAGIFSVLT